MGSKYDLTQCIHQLMMNRCVNQCSGTGVERKKTRETNVTIPVAAPSMGEEMIQERMEGTIPTVKWLHQDTS